ncbi:MAG TPA: cupredoxin domain-containing protein [Candidatus Bathyarchaeia archaeon]|nr:cupredoxin domain-containing protein [Candidatus Bathyarchaeia archaeon]
MKKSVSAFLLASVVALALAGCGSNQAASTDSASSSAPAATQSADGVVEIKLSAKNFEFDQKEIRVKKGDKVKLTLANTEGMHGVSLPDFNVDIKGDGSAEFTADKTGEFQFICSVMCGAGHDTMTGKLIVE